MYQKHTDRDSEDGIMIKGCPCILLFLMSPWQRKLSSHIDEKGVGTSLNIFNTTRRKF